MLVVSAAVGALNPHATAADPASTTTDKPGGNAGMRDVFPVFTERSFANVWKPATGFNPFFKDDNRTRPFDALTASFHIFGGAENMGENERGRIDPKFSGSPEVAVPEGKVCLRFSALTKGAMAGMTLKDLKLPNQDPTGAKRGWRGSTPFEEYIADFSTYKDVGKFHFRYWARKGEKFKVQAKIQGIEVVGTGQWESAIIEPLHKELHTHHILMAFQNLNDGPAELYLDDAFYYTGGVPAAKPNPASPFNRREAQKVCDHLQNLAAVSKEELARDIAVLAPGGQLKADDQVLARFVEGLVQSLSGKKVSAGNAAVLAGDLEQTLNPGQGSVRQTQGAVRNFAHTLKLADADHAQADKVGADLTVLAKVPKDPGPFDEPRHPFRFALSEAPKYDKAVLVEDFESGTDIFKTWYQPYWSTGIVATFDSQHKSGGNRGLTISNTGPTTKRSSMAKFPRPHQDLSGCNALRLWFKPYGLKDSEGTVSMGFIDGSEEIWQVDLPEVLSGTEPCVIQVRLADFRRVLRRNNGRIDLENRDFCFWMTGTYKFTVDDILFVHDPALPEFPKPPNSL